MPAKERSRGPSAFWYNSLVSAANRRMESNWCGEVAMGRMTEEQAKIDPRRSVLLQCVGASNVVQPDFIKGEVKKNAVYLLCSDGFRHQISDEEIMDKLGPEATPSNDELQYGCVYLTELVKNRKETDNISVVVVKTF